jgi:hypothetical protein
MRFWAAIQQAAGAHLVADFLAHHGAQAVVHFRADLAGKLAVGLGRVATTWMSTFR